MDKYNNTESAVTLDTGKVLDCGTEVLDKYNEAFEELAK